MSRRYAKANSHQRRWLSGKAYAEPVTPCTWDGFLFRLGMNNSTALDAIRGGHVLLCSWIRRFRLELYVPEEHLAAAKMSVSEREVTVALQSRRKRI